MRWTSLLHVSNLILDLQLDTILNAFRLWLQAKLRAALKRSSDEAVERENAELGECGSFAEATKKLEQRKLDLARVMAYASGLGSVLNSLG